MAGAAGALAALSMAPAHAMLVLQGPQDFPGSGLGSVNTLLTIQSPGSSSFEEGSVGRTVDGTSDVLTGDAADNSITLSDLQLTIFSPTGTVLFNSGSISPIDFADTFTGTGNAGWVFALDETQAAAAQAAGFSGSFGDNRIGLFASVNNATGGPETFFVASAGGAVTPPIPEPETYALMLAGLGVVGFMTSRRRRRGG
jgi:hypothetical protein